MRFYKYRTHSDQRRAGSYDIIPGIDGDFNFTKHPKGVIPEELHMHKFQTDYFAVVKGKVMFYLKYRNGRKEKVIVTENDHKTIIIPPGVWHGYTALKPSIMVFYLTHKYDPKDEFRRKVNSSEWKIPKRGG